MENSSQMEELCIRELANKYNFIVPEIQREYVWGKNDNQILDTFFNDIEEKYNGSNDLTNNCFNDLKESLKPVLDDNFSGSTLKQIEIAIDRFETNRGMNIGFLYSYKPNYYVYNDISEDVYLIDGQQRFTTLFLSLLYFSIKESKLDAFIKLFRINLAKEKIGFDYRVRTLTHNFLIDLISNTKENSADLVAIQNKTWFLSEYSKDVSIQAMLGTFTKLNQKFNETQNDYFEFLCNQIKFWHFKTEETSQGEELYITMNSRGKSLSDNEILRAKLFEKVPKNEIRLCGQRWEDWQDFFWSKKGTNENSDNGFNEFLRWVQIITMINRGKIDTSNEDENGSDKKAIIEIIKWEKDGLKLDIEYLNLKEIDYYFEAVQYIFKSFSVDCITPKYPNYFNKDILNNNWLCPKDRATIKQIDCFRLLPVIEYCKLILQNGRIINEQNLFRVFRYFYNLQEIETVSKAANVACINGIKLISDLLSSSDDIADINKLTTISKTLLTEEEKYKFNLFKNSKEREALEQEFWETEDHKLNSGRIGHLLQVSFENHSTIDSFKYDNSFNVIRQKQFDLEKFKAAKKKFFNLNNDSKSKNISSQLWGYFLITTYYTISNYGTNLQVITCKTSDYQALISREFLKMVLEIGENQHSDDYFHSLSAKFFNVYTTLNQLKGETDLKNQLFCYFILLSKNGNWFWNNGRNFGRNDRNLDAEFKALFDFKILFQHYDQKWGGAEWRNVNLSPLEDGIDYLQILQDQTFLV